MDAKGNVARSMPAGTKMDIGRPKETKPTLILHAVVESNVSDTKYPAMNGRHARAVQIHAPDPHPCDESLLYSVRRTNSPATLQNVLRMKSCLQTSWSDMSGCPGLSSTNAPEDLACTAADGHVGQETEQRAENDRVQRQAWNEYHPMPQLKTRQDLPFLVVWVKKRGALPAIARPSA